LEQCGSQRSLSVRVRKKIQEVPRSHGVIVSDVLTAYCF
jgi:hypothetical protein